MRCGIPARKTSIAERGELGSTSARSNFPRAVFCRRRKRFRPARRKWFRSPPDDSATSSRNFSGVSSAICASGNFSRSRSSAGVVITASPSQFVPRTKMRRGWRLADGGWLFMAVFHLQLPFSIFDLVSAAFQRRWTQNQFAGSRRTAISKARFTSRMMSSDGRGWPFSCVGICSPSSSRHFAGADAETKGGVKFAVIAQRENGRAPGRYRTIVAKKRRRAGPWCFGRRAGRE